MSYRRVRIYRGHSPETNLIGFSASAADAILNPRFDEFLTTRGYDWAQSMARPSLGVSIVYAEVRPPLTEEHIIEFGALCVGEACDGKFVSGIVDPYHDGTLVLDNRGKYPDGPMGEGILIAEG